MYGHGLQTWEYSPTYALRSYIYVLFHVSFGRLAQFIGIEMAFGKIGVFYAIRIVLALLTAVCETALIKAMSRQDRFGRNTAYIMGILLATNAGMFNASAAMLPQTFTMNTLLCCFAAWMQRRFDWAIFFMGLSSLVGWPFSVLTGIALAVDALKSCRLIQTLKYGIVSAAVCIVPSVAIDYYYYHKPVFAVLNIAMYNAPKPGGGAELYGTEPAMFYVKNLALNFNIIAALAVAALLWSVVAALGLCQGRRARSAARQILGYCFVPLITWVGLMFSMPHKEERFLFIVYPLICMAAAYVLGEIAYVGARTKRRAIAALIIAVAVTGTSIISGARITSMVHNYGAPLQVYAKLEQVLPHQPPQQQTNVCVGKEWYRFPSSFFLPEHANARLQFLKSNFDGLLPKQFAPLPQGTYVPPTHMNEDNREEPSRYVHVDDCDAIVDLELLEHQEEQHYSLMVNDGWRVAAYRWFLDAPRSNDAIGRAFYVPGRSNRVNQYKKYVVVVKEKKEKAVVEEEEDSM
jgi:alpha-1,2-mannosyltransferase